MPTNSSLLVKFVLSTLGVLGFGCGGAQPTQPTQSASMVGRAKHDVEATERAFAATMAKRDFKGFVSFLSDEAVFVSERKTLRGKDEIAAAWKPFYDKPSAPFSWEPAIVEVLDSGSLALSTGPVHDPMGKLIATFTSVWRREPSGWRIIFDRGVDVVECSPSSTAASASTSHESDQHGQSGSHSSRMQISDAWATNTAQEHEP